MPTTDDVRGGFASAAEGAGSYVQGIGADGDGRRPGAPNPKPRVVVADDDRLARQMLVSTLVNAGFHVDTVEDGQEALDLVGRGGVDLVLLDVAMPRLSGLEACRLVKAMTTDAFVPVVLVTAKADTASRVEGLKSGADDCVSKPFDEEELLARVGALLRIKRAYDHVAAQRAHLEQQSVHDELTGLYNYRYICTRINEEFKRAERYHEPFACVLVDIDRLRALNDTVGRSLGDAVICRVADGIRRSVREVDVVARYGGDEFLLVLPSTHFAGSITVAERIWRETAANPIEHAGLARQFTLSIGVSLYPSRDVRTKDALLRAAESALSQAKREGGHRICVFQQQGHIYTSSDAAEPPSAPAPSAPRRRSSDSMIQAAHDEPREPSSRRLDHAAPPSARRPL